MSRIGAQIFSDVSMCPFHWRRIICVLSIYIMLLFSVSYSKIVVTTLIQFGFISIFRMCRNWKIVKFHLKCGFIYWISVRGGKCVFIFVKYLFIAIPFHFTHSEVIFFRVIKIAALWNTVKLITWNSFSYTMFLIQMNLNLNLNETNWKLFTF